VNDRSIFISPQADTNLVNRLSFVAIPVLCTPHAHFLVAIPQWHRLNKSGTAVTTRGGIPLLQRAVRHRVTHRG